MRIPLTKYGLPQVAIFPSILLTAMVVLAIFLDSIWLLCCAELIIAIILVWMLAFFRDPYRRIPADENILIAPADGKITDIEVVQEESFIDGKAIRIGIFLSIFNVHINRMPCAVAVEKVVYRSGKYKNAMSPESGRINESNDIMLIRQPPPADRLIVRQISGAIARRIVCRAKAGDNFAGGEKFGMIKFGSRTELFVPESQNAECLVKIGDKVRAGSTVMVRYQENG
jgi:phosphatidylserine decarboxylase